MGQFLVKISAPPGSNLSENQHFRRKFGNVIVGSNDLEDFSGFHRIAGLPYFA